VSMSIDGVPLDTSRRIQHKQRLQSCYCLNSACALARFVINQKCYKGGDAGHRQQRQDAINALKKCKRLRVQCCKDDGF